MPVLSFPCAVTHHNHSRQLSQRRTWIKGHDLRALALAATELLAVKPERCEYMLFSPAAVAGAASVSHALESAGVFLEVLHGGLSALVGPMGGPTPPSTIEPDSAYRLDDLLSRVGLETNAEDEAESARALPVLVTYAGHFHELSYPPPRETHESDAQYATRCATAERVRLERARHEGIHLIHYEVPSAQWKAPDLEALLGLAYRLLPTLEPRWRDSGTIAQDTFAAERGEREPILHYCLEVARGDYAAYLRLPVFPTLAVAEWLGDRRCDINLCHPVVKIEGAARVGR